MIKLTDILNETASEAAEQAHKLGLISGGWGTWQDETGKTVAKTIQGKLVRIEFNTPSTQNLDQSDEEDANYGAQVRPRFQAQYDTGAYDDEFDDIQKFGIPEEYEEKARTFYEKGESNQNRKFLYDVMFGMVNRIKKANINPQDLNDDEIEKISSDYGNKIANNINLNKHAQHNDERIKNIAARMTLLSQAALEELRSPSQPQSTPSTFDKVKNHFGFGK